MKKIIKSIFHKIPVLDKLYVKISFAIDHRKEKGREKSKIKRQLNPLLKEIRKARKERRVFLLLTSTYPNIGDQAIVLSAIDLLHTCGINYFEVTDRMLAFLYKNGKTGVFNGANIVFNGGGYLGTIWLNSELYLRSVIQNNPQSKIIILPNTIYYENNDFGKKELQNSIDIYNAHKELTIYARENISYEFMKPIYKDVKLCPDIVLRFNRYEPGTTRTGCLICLRNDVERTLDDNSHKTIIKQVETLFDRDITITDMYEESESLEDKVDLRVREALVNKKLAEFKSAKLVVTDRLHAMIFSAITGTPCIVVNSKSPKVKGCYEWLKDLRYIRLCDNVGDIVTIYDEIKDTNPCYNNKDLLPYYDELLTNLGRLK